MRNNRCACRNGFLRVTRLSEAFSTFAIRLVLYFTWGSLAWFGTAAAVYKWRNKAALWKSLNFLPKTLWHQRSLIPGSWIRRLLIVFWACHCIHCFFLTAHAPYCLPYYMPTHLIHININIITFEVQTINSSVYGVNAAQCWYKYRDCRRWTLSLQNNSSKRERAKS